jgi:hypothetical protein
VPRHPEFIHIDKATLVDLYWGQRLTLTEIGTKLGVHFMTVHRRMIEYGIPRRNMGTRRADGDHPSRPAEVLTPGFLKASYQRKGMTTDQIAAETGFNSSTVRYYLRQAGIPIRGPGFIRQHHIDRRELGKFRRQGWSNNRIGDHYDCSVTTVERALRRYGLMGR